MSDDSTEKPRPTLTTALLLGMTALAIGVCGASCAPGFDEVTGTAVMGGSVIGAGAFGLMAGVAALRWMAAR